MAQMSDTDREAFLADTRYAILSTLRADGSPVSVPVWFDWDGSRVRMFTYLGAPKLKRIATDARASVVVANNVDEKERWVAFDGSITIRDEGGFALAEKLAERYWDLDDPDRAAALESWRAMESGWRLLELAPDKIRSYAD